jgi:hypothetical protein
VLVDPFGFAQGRHFELGSDFALRRKVQSSPRMNQDSNAEWRGQQAEREGDGEEDDLQYSVDGDAHDAEG